MTKQDFHSRFDIFEEEEEKIFLFSSFHLS